MGGDKYVVHQLQKSKTKMWGTLKRSDNLSKFAFEIAKILDIKEGDSVYVKKWDKDKKVALELKKA